MRNVRWWSLLVLSACLAAVGVALCGCTLTGDAGTVTYEPPVEEE